MIGTLCRAAILDKAAAIVTANTKHFPHAVLEPLGLEQIAPDQFLLDQWHLDPEELMDRIEEQVAAISWSLDDLLERLAIHAPAFVAELNGYRAAG